MKNISTLVFLRYNSIYMSYLPSHIDGCVTLSSDTAAGCSETSAVESTPSLTDLRVDNHDYTDYPSTGRFIPASQRSRLQRGHGGLHPQDFSQDLSGEVRICAILCSLFHKLRKVTCKKCINQLLTWDRLFFC